MSKVKTATKEELMRLLQKIADQYLKKKNIPGMMYTEEEVAIDMNSLLLDFLPYLEKKLK